MTAIHPRLTFRLGCGPFDFHQGLDRRAQGRVVKRMGDGVPVEFSAARLTQCAAPLRIREAEKVMARLRQVEPALSISNLRDHFPFRRSDDLAKWAEGLRKAGLPE